MMDEKKGKLFNHDRLTKSTMCDITISMTRNQIVNLDIKTKDTRVHDNCCYL